MSDVTQADREAVKAFHHAAAAHMLAAIKDKGFADALGENNESHPIYQAFAAHRIAAEKAVLDRLRNLPDDVANKLVTLTGHRFEHIDAIANNLADAMETKR